MLRFLVSGLRLEHLNEDERIYVRVGRRVMHDAKLLNCLLCMCH